ncbi:MAG TPA: GNAT family N-acetyltransferase [Bacilli bacterium]|nr:GNAT family N-acetyltransferase [Bacilli bacterium]
MKNKLVIVSKKDKLILENLLQLYLHDISYYFPIDFDSSSGKYIYDDLEKYFNGSNNLAYFIKIGNNIGGFILVDKENDSYILQEIFVLNNYKNKGIGGESVNKLFNKNRGKWIIKSLPSSPLAEKFWLKTINNYTNGNYKIEYIGKYNRAVFTFENF